MDLKADHYDAKPLLRHRKSFESMITPDTETPSLPENTSAQAKIRLYHILEHFEAVAANEQPQKGYNRPALVRLTYEYSRSDHSKSLFLSSFFEFLALPLAGNATDSDVDFGDPEVEARLSTSVNGFAEHLMDNFFLPLKAVANKTPQPTPITHSAAQRALNSVPSQSFAGTPHRISNLRGTCLVRDRHRCVISRKFDNMESVKRCDAAQGGNALDDDGVLIKMDDVRVLEVAHILPHSLVEAPLDSFVSSARQTALNILNMFDVGVARLIEGAEIDRPFNAITLTLDHHIYFGSFRIFFKPIPDQPHTYDIGTFKTSVGPTLGLPVTRTLYLTEDKNIEPPLPRLLAIHCAIGHILHLSGAGEYIDCILRDAEEYGVRSDGSTKLGRLVGLSLGGWDAGVGDRV
ncbi:hypothetical protein RB595_003751 [Gaeumannomyces hyphopodioides]